MIACLDNMVLGWGVRGVAKEEQQDWIPRAKALLAKLEEDRAIVIVPAPVAAEYMFFVPLERQAEAMQTLSSRFRVMPFDAQAAAICAELWVKRNEGTHLSAAVRGYAPRPALKFDLQIVSIALARKADVIYSHDQGVKSVAGSDIKVEDIPPVTSQAKLL